MALAATNLTDGGTTASATSATTASVSPAADALILLSICAYDSADDLTSVTPTITGGGMTTWDLVDVSFFDSTASDYSKVWVFRSQQASPTSGTIGISFGAVSVSRISWSVDQFTGATVGSNGATAIVQAVDAAGTSGATTLTGTLAAFGSANNMSFGAFGVQSSNPITFTVGSGYTELGKYDTSTSNAQILTEYKVGDDDPDASWSATSVFKSGVIGIEIQEAVAPATGIVVEDSWYVEDTGDTPTTVAVSGFEAGDVAVVVCFSFNSSDTTFHDPPTDNGGNTYTERTENTRTTTFRSICSISDAVITTPPTSIEFEVNGGTGLGQSLVVLRLSGVDTANAFVDADEKTQTVDDPTSDTIDTAADGLAISGITYDGDAISLAATGWTTAEEVETSAASPFAVVYKTTTGTSVSTAWTTGSSADYAMALASYRPIVTGPTLKGIVDGSSSGSPQTINLIPSATIAAGSVAVICMNYVGGTPSGLSAVDSSGNTWTRREYGMEAGFSSGAAILDAYITTPLTTSSTITFTFGEFSFIHAYLYELVGDYDPSDYYVDSSINEESANTAYNSGAATAVGDVVAIALNVAADQTITFTPTGSFTELHDEVATTPGNRLQTQWKEATAGSVESTATASGSDPGFAAIALYAEHAPSAAASYAEEVLADNPIAYWKCDEASGNLISSVGTAPLTPSGAPLYQQAASPVGGYSIYCSDVATAVDYFSGELSTLVTTSGAEMMVEMWFKSNWTPGALSSELFAMIHPGSTNYGVWMRDDTGIEPTPRLGFNTWNNDAYGVTFPPNVYNNRWIMVNMAFKEGNRNACRLWIDSVEQPMSDTQTTGGAHAFDQTIYLAAGFGVQHGMDGWFTQVSVYNGWLSQARINAHFAARTRFQRVLYKSRPRMVQR